MTAEIAIVNRLAITLAADSAMTSTYYKDGKKEQRFFKGTNKIFELSAHEPVGLMIFNNASLQNAPWDMIVKDYRAHLGSTSFASLLEYAEDFFTYISKHLKLFTPAYRDEQFMADSVRATAIHLFLLSPFREDFDDKQEETNAINSYIREQAAALEGKNSPEHFTQDKINKSIDDYAERIAERFRQQFLPGIDIGDEVDVQALARVGIASLFKEYEKFLEYTGIVIAGFGKDEYFPAYIEYKIYGIILDTVVYDKIEHNGASLSKARHIKPFATSEMVDTFLMGFSSDALSAVKSEYRSAAKKILAQALGTSEEDVDVKYGGMINEELEKHKENWVKASLDAHFDPLLDVISMLPVDEMTELAETLINLESLKEKVTRPTESVGGPIDVAVITKGDGFIWIKRKHYFDPSLNRRFFERLGREY